MFAYCNNNPVMLVDPSGHRPAHNPSPGASPIMTQPPPAPRPPGSTVAGQSGRPWNPVFSPPKAGVEGKPPGSAAAGQNPGISGIGVGVILLQPSANDILLLEVGPVLIDVLGAADTLLGTGAFGPKLSGLGAGINFVINLHEGQSVWRAGIDAGGGLLAGASGTAIGASIKGGPGAVVGALVAGWLWNQIMNPPSTLRSPYDFWRPVW